MGFWGNLRAAATTSAASQFVRKHLEVEASEALSDIDVKDLAHRLTMSLWASVPELAQQRDRPQAVLVAAAALAKGIRDFDKAKASRRADVLHRCLSRLLQYDAHKLVDVERLSGIDARLWSMAHEAFN